MTTTKKDPLVCSIERWLKKPTASQVKLANFLGYSSSNAIYNWIYRGRVPKNRRDQVKAFLGQERRG